MRYEKYKRTLTRRALEFGGYIYIYIYIYDAFKELPFKYFSIGAIDIFGNMLFSCSPGGSQKVPEERKKI